MARPFVLLHFPRNLSFSLELSIRCCVRSSLAGRVKFTNPYGAPSRHLCASSPSRFKNPLCSLPFSRVHPSFFFSLSLSLTFFPVFIYLSTSSTSDIQPKFFLSCRLTCWPSVSVPSPTTVFQQRYRPILRAISGRQVPRQELFSTARRKRKKKKWRSRKRGWRVETTVESAR